MKYICSTALVRPAKVSPGTPEVAGDRSDDIVYGDNLNSSDILVQSSAELGILKQITKEFGISKILDFKYPLHHSTTSTKTIIETANGNFFVKRKPAYAENEDSLTLSGEFQDYLAAHLPDLVPALLRSTTGNTYCRYSTRGYVAMPEVQAGVFLGHAAQIWDAGRVLALIHNHSEGFKQSYSKPFPPFRSSQDEALQFINLASEISEGFDDPHRDHVLKELRGIVDRYTHDNNGARSIVVHGDYAPSNVLFVGDRVAGVTDFDNVSHHMRIRDLAEAILTFGGGMNYLGTTSSLRTPIATSLQPNLVEQFLNGYKSSLKTSLSEDELEMLVGEIALSWVEHMGLGVVRGDFGFESIRCSLDFIDNLESTRKALISLGS
jgi:Ser/Thr protein kinase RdoA (MazF antagonist)